MTLLPLEPLVGAQALPPGLVNTYEEVQMASGYTTDPVVSCPMQSTCRFCGGPLWSGGLPWRFWLFSQEWLECMHPTHPPAKTCFMWKELVGLYLVCG